MKFPIEEIKIGHWTDTEAETGCTVIRFPKSVVASGEVRGGAPATREFELLAHLMRSKGRAFTRRQLLNTLWENDYVGDERTVDVHIRWLREKIEEDSSKPKKIITIRGYGYRLDE